MGTLTQLQQNRRVIHDFTTTTLAAIPSAFARLTYLASLRDLSSGRYEHAGLTAVYPREAVQQALEQCHEEIFERIVAEEGQKLLWWRDVPTDDSPIGPSARAVEPR